MQGWKSAEADVEVKLVSGPLSTHCRPSFVRCLDDGFPCGAGFSLTSRQSKHTFVNPNEMAARHKYWTAS